MTVLKSVKLSFLAVLSFSLLYSCASKVTNDSSLKPAETSMKSISQTQQNFAFNLYQSVYKNHKEEENNLISPLSIYLDLGMLLNAASGKTQTEMCKAMGILPADLADFNQSAKTLIQDLTQSDSLIHMDIANSIWYKDDLSVKSEFLKLNKDYFKAEINAADFEAPQTVERINNWVSLKTQHKISSIIDQIQPGEVMFLINAIYFKGDWMTPFNPKLTYKDEFYKDTSDSVQTDFMYKESHFNYLDNAQLQMVELPYDHQKFSMYVLLPHQSSQIEEIINNLNTEKFKDLQSQLQSKKIKLYLPKWEASYSIDNLKNELSEMGMAGIFENDANFSKLFTRTSTKVSQVKHKTYIKVDEAGTEAAAATSTGMMTTSINLNETKMKANRPFIYFITDNKTHQILFIGTVKNPNES